MGAAVAAGLPALTGLLVALTMPRGPVTALQALIVIAADLVVGVVAGLALRSPWVMVLHKSGSVDASRSAVFFVYAPSGPYVMSIYTRDNVDRQWTRENEAEAAIREMARAVWTHYEPGESWEPPAGGEAF